MTGPELTMATVNGLDREGFVATFGHVLEDAPDLAAEVWAAAPFADRDALVAGFLHVLDQLDEPAALVLLRAHPELGTRRPMAAASVAEQSAAGLRGAGGDIERRLELGNRAYRERFGFPFIVAVRGMDGAAIADELERRLANPAEAERAEAVRQIGRIAALRVEQVVPEP